MAGIAFSACGTPMGAALRRIGTAPRSGWRWASLLGSGAGTGRLDAAILVVGRVARAAPVASGGDCGGCGLALRADLGCALRASRGSSWSGSRFARSRFACDLSPPTYRSQPPPRQPPSRRRRRKPAACRLAVANIHRSANLRHRVDDFIGRDRNSHARHAHLDAGQRDRRCSRIAENTRHFDKATDGVADQTERALHGQTNRGIGLGGRACEQFDAGSGSHGSGRAGFSLTAALRTRKRRTLGNHRADEAGCCQRANQRFFGCSAAIRKSQQHTRQHTSCACSRCGDDHAHRRVYFLHGKRPGQRLGKQRAAQRSVLACRHFARVATDEPAHAADVAR